MHFVSLFFLNERNITTSLLMIHLKRTVVHYSNLNSSSVNKPFLNYAPLNMLFLFFDFLFTFILTRILSKKYEVTVIFLLQISEFISRCSILQNIRTPNLVILKWRYFEHKAKFEKNGLFSLGSKF